MTTHEERERALLVHLAVPNGPGGDHPYPDPAAGRISHHHLETQEERDAFRPSVLCSMAFLAAWQGGGRTLNRSLVTCPRCAMLADFIKDRVTWGVRS